MPSRCRWRWSRKAARPSAARISPHTGEGWALYCERLGAEMGIYETAYETFGMLSYQARRAARLVVDTGIHAQGPDARPGAGAYLHANTALSAHEIETEVDRYISWPGQALSYYLGEMAILNGRRKAENGAGANSSTSAPSTTWCWNVGRSAAARAGAAHRQLHRRRRQEPVSGGAVMA